MAFFRLVFLMILGSACCAQDPQQPLTAQAIMARVAANQDRAEALRAEYVYNQHIHVATRTFGGKLMRDETSDYRVVPTPKGTERHLQKITGRGYFKKKYFTYDTEPKRTDEGVDGSLVRSFREGDHDSDSKDGIHSHLFPLTTKQQEGYEFRMIGEETMSGRPAYHIGFRPKDAKEIAWAGEAFIDKEDFQPVLVFTKLSRRIPFAVRTLLGTDVPGVGFNVKYQRQPAGVWFPVSFGTEFRLHILFLLKRDVAMSLQNSAFEHTDVKSVVKYEQQ